MVLATLLAAAAGFFAVSQATGILLISQEDYDTLNDIGARYSKLYSMQKAIETQFLWEVDQDKQMDALYDALIETLDDQYSAYMDKEEYEAWQSYVQGVFTGVGVVFSQDKSGDFVISKVISGGPADSAGLKAGDVLLKVDGKAYEDADQMAMHMRGEEGTSVKVTYRRGSETKEAELVRAQVEEPSVYAETLDKQYGYIRISAFESGTAAQFKRELDEFETKGVKGLVIDLPGQRRRPGGRRCGYCRYASAGVYHHPHRG